MPAMPLRVSIRIPNPYPASQESLKDVDPQQRSPHSKEKCSVPPSPQRYIVSLLDGVVVGVVLGAKNHYTHLADAWDI